MITFDVSHITDEEEEGQGESNPQQQEPLPKEKHEKTFNHGSLVNK